MSITVVLQQMVIIFILIGIGMLLFRRGLLSEEGSKQISGLIINVTNPALLICSALDDGPKVSLRELGIALAAYAAVFAILTAVGFLLPCLLREAAFGCEKEVSLDRVEECEHCHGSGAAPGTSPETCSNCGGTGQVQQRRQTPMGVFATSGPCPRCGGKGKVIGTPCKSCGGSGQVRQRKTLKVNIPAGIDDGQIVSLRGQGNAGKNGGPAGDLQIVIAVQPHPLFQRDGNSVYFNAPITFTQAVLGGELEIPTIDGKVKYEIPEGTQTGTTFRLRGKGIPNVNGRGRGDQFVTVNIETPRNLNREQKEALRRFSESLKEQNYEERKGFFNFKFKK